MRGRVPCAQLLWRCAQPCGALRRCAEEELCELELRSARCEVGSDLRARLCTNYSSALTSVTLALSNAPRCSTCLQQQPHKIKGAMNEFVALDFTGMFRSKSRALLPSATEPAAEVHTHALAAHYRVGHLYSLEQCQALTPMAYVEDFGEPELYYIRVPEGSYTPLPREQSKLRGEYRPRDSVWLYDYCLHRHNAFEKVRAEPSWPQAPPRRSWHLHTGTSGRTRPEATTF